MSIELIISILTNVNRLRYLWCFSKFNGLLVVVTKKEADFNLVLNPHGLYLLHTIVDTRYTCNYCKEVCKRNADELRSSNNKVTSLITIHTWRQTRPCLWRFSLTTLQANAKSVVEARKERSVEVECNDPNQ